jgi:hypothetical protein
LKYYTIKELSEKIGVKSHRVRHLILKEKIRSVRKDGINSAYKIPSSEVEKAQEILGVDQSKKNVANKPKEKTVAQVPPEIKLEDFLDMQKTLADTMRNLASTQETIAETLKLMAERM